MFHSPHKDGYVIHFWSAAGWAVTAGVRHAEMLSRLRQDFSQHALLLAR
jgi:hypothetical protein